MDWWLTEDAHGAVDGGGGDAVAGGGLAAALEAAEEGEVGAEELGLVVGVVGHVVAVAAEVEVVGGAAVPEHGPGLLPARPVGAAVVPVPREHPRQPRPRAAVPRQLRHVRPEQRHRAPTSCRSASASLSAALRIAAAAAVGRAGRLLRPLPAAGIREEERDEPVDPGRLPRRRRGERVGRCGRLDGGGGGGAEEERGRVEPGGDALEGAATGGRGLHCGADSFAPVFSGFASRRAAAGAVAWRGVPRWRVAVRICYVFFFVSFFWVVCWGVGATARGGYLRRGLGGRVVRRFWVGIKRRRRRILEEAPARRKGDAWWRDSSRLVFGLAPRRGEL